MFCQKSGGKAIRIVATMELSKKIIDLSELDSIMQVRLTNISDLVASEGKYHLSCWIQFQRKVNKIKDIATDMDYGKQKSQQSLYRLCSDLISGLGSGHIYAGADPAKNLTVADLSSSNSRGEGSPPPPRKIFETIAGKHRLLRSERRIL